MALRAPSKGETLKEKPAGGGSPFGVHYITDFATCPTKFYWRNLAIWPGVYLSVGPDGAITDAREAQAFADSPTLPVGVEQRGFAPALDTGSRVHAGVAAFYLSGCRDGEDSGERSLDAMLEAAREDPPWPDDPTEGHYESLALADKMLRRYFEVYKAEDAVRVAFDPEGQPLVEREFWLDLDYNGYRFTCRADLVYWQNGEYLRFMEHKTCRASDLPKWLKRAELDGQFTGQFLMGRSHFPDQPFDAVSLNALVKDRGAKSNLPDMMRKPYSRSNAQLEKFRIDTVRKLKRIDESVEEWRDLIGRGMEPEDAAKVVFDGSPSGYECVGTGISCTFATLCSNRERLSSILLDSFQPRQYKYQWENPLRVQRGDGE